MVIPEAFVYGIPVVCLRQFSGPGESIDKDSGIAVPYTTYEETVQNLAKAIDRIFSDTDYQQVLSEGARNRFESWFDWKVKGEIVNKIYGRNFE